jgi:hypothetical protein
MRIKLGVSISSIGLQNEGLKSNESAPCLIVTMRQRKQNQHGKVEYISCIWTADPILCHCLH